MKKFLFLIYFLILCLCLTPITSCGIIKNIVESDVSDNDKQTVTKTSELTEEEKDQETTEQENEKILAEGQISQSQAYEIKNDNGMQLNIPENGLFENNEIKVTEYLNDIKGNENAIFSSKAYAIDLKEPTFFAEPIKITLPYDESIIPPDIPESAVFAVFTDEEGNLYYQGGKVDEENNTITIESYHTSNWYTGVFNGIKALGQILYDSSVFGDEYISKQEQENLRRQRTVEFYRATEVLSNPELQDLKDLERAVIASEYQIQEAYDKCNFTFEAIKKTNFVAAATDEEDIIQGIGKEGAKEFAFQVTEFMLKEMAPKLAGAGAAYIFYAGVAVGYVSFALNIVYLGQQAYLSGLSLAAMNELRIAVEDYQGYKRAFDYATYPDSFLNDIEFTKEWNQKYEWELDSIEQIDIDKAVAKVQGWDTDTKTAEETTTEQETTETYVVETTASEFTPVTSISIAIIYGPQIINNMCVYRFQVNANGDMKSISWDWDDSNGSWGPTIAQLNYEYGDSFPVTVTVKDNYGNSISQSIKPQNLAPAPYKPPVKKPDYGQDTRI